MARLCLVVVRISPCTCLMGIARWFRLFGKCGPAQGLARHVARLSDMLLKNRPKFGVESSVPPVQWARSLLKCDRLLSSAGNRRVWTFSPLVVRSPLQILLWTKL